MQSLTIFSRKEIVDRLSGIFSFDNHINGIRRKTNQKFHTLMRIMKCISEGKTLSLNKAFLISQFVTAYSSGCAKADL